MMDDGERETGGMLECLNEFSVDKLPHCSQSLNEANQANLTLEADQADQASRSSKRCLSSSAAPCMINRRSFFLDQELLLLHFIFEQCDQQQQCAK